MKTELRGPTTTTAINIEKLLLHCAAALESNDTTLAQQVMWVLHNVITASNGDPNLRRLASWFLVALVDTRASSLCPANTTMTKTLTSSCSVSIRPLSIIELAEYIDLTPWHRFGFSASNGAILKSMQGKSKLAVLHIIDFSITHCMQWPTLMDALAKRPEGPPSLLKITVPSCSLRPPVPPLLAVPIEDIASRLACFARSRNLRFELNVAKSENYTYTKEAVDGEEEEEVLVVNCQSWLRYQPAKDEVLKSIRAMSPSIVTITDEDADLDSPSLTSRIMASFKYFWIPFDAMETLSSSLQHHGSSADQYEAYVGRKIKNVVGFEGEERIERLETGDRVRERMRRAGFASVEFGEETVKEVKGVLDEHASGWGMKEEEDMLVLTWKGHSSVFTAAWVPV